VRKSWQFRAKKSDAPTAVGAIARYVYSTTRNELLAIGGNAWGFPEENRKEEEADNAGKNEYVCDRFHE